MMYPYLIFADETEVTHSQILERNGQKEIEVHFERPTENGFDTARCILPEYVWIKRDGFSGDEVRFFEEFLRHNAYLMYRYAEGEGMRIA